MCPQLREAIVALDMHPGVSPKSPLESPSLARYDLEKYRPILWAQGIGGEHR